MTDTRFTPGPLKVVNAIGDKDQICYVDVLQADVKHRGSIAQCHDAENIDGVTREEMFANAHLIAAAPELYEALETFVSEYVDFVESGDAGFWDAEEENKVKAARAALAKARGEA